MGFIKYDQFAYKIATEYGFSPDDQTKYDIHYNPENEYWSVLANYKDGSNCLVKFDPSEFS